MRLWAMAAAVLMFTALGVTLVPPQPAAARPAVERIDKITPTRSAIWVRSPAMRRTVQVQVLHPASVSGGPRPSFYLLDGSEADDHENMWTMKTSIVDFFARKNVNVVLPVGGKGSYYTDWQRPDPVLGVSMWETFLTKELPALIAANFNGNGRSAIGGLSMGGEAALILAARHPGRYRAVAAYSICPDILNYAPVVRVTVRGRGGDANNMWGVAGDPAWAAHDPMTHAEKLRGAALYLSAGNGAPGHGEAGLSPLELASRVASGSTIEWLAQRCTMAFQLHLEYLRIPATFRYRDVGTHAWAYWDGDLRDSWPTVARALNLRA